MTNELNTIAFAIEGVPYSQVTIALESDFDAVMSNVAAFRDAYVAWMYPNVPADEQAAEPNRAEAPPLPPEPDAPRPPQRPQGAPQPGTRPMAGATGNGSGQRSATHQPNAYGVTLYCPIHEGAVLAPSVRNKNMDYVESIEREIPASWFHTGPDGKSCSTYQSRAIWGPVVAPAAAAR